MSPSYEAEILERLARIETKLDANADHAGRIRRLELLVTAQAVALLALYGKAAGINLPGLN